MANNIKDFRNVKQTQFDRGQVLKGSFSELQSALRTYGSTAVLKDAYTHFIQSVDGNGNPTKVTYYQAISATTDRINVRADIGGNLAGTYFTLQEYISKKTFVFWFNVSGLGSAPGIGDVEIQVDLQANDPSSLVAFKLKNAVQSTEEFIVMNYLTLSSYIDIQYFQFGETVAIDVGTSGFIANRLVQGESVEVGEIELAYDPNGNPVYNGNTLTGLKYNVYTASFEVSNSSTGIVDSEGDELDINPDGSINTVPKKDYDSFIVTARDANENITEVEYYLGAALVRTVSISYDVNGCIQSYSES